ncbi:MAG: DUF2019 domain-containing protein [Chitinophagaceae bacterium]|nr:DUF2019 domain-containing protein [Chitinophagaceae bacterium]
MTQLQTIFIENAIKHGEAIGIGDYRTANKLHTKLGAAYQLIKQDGKWNELIELITHPDDNVKLWAATYLLESNTKVALRILKELKNSTEITGLTASTTIDIWNKGLLRL